MWLWVWFSVLLGLSCADPLVYRVLLSQQTIVNNIDTRDEDGWTALHAAIYWEHMEAAAMLVKKGASINLVTKTVSGCGCGCGLASNCVLQGDTIDDLCRPEFEEELTELKELCEVHRIVAGAFTNSSNLSSPICSSS